MLWPGYWVNPSNVSFKGRVQKEYYSNPMGPYIGPYDQSENIPLSPQLPRSRMTYKKYIKFHHQSDSNYKVFKVGKMYDEVKIFKKLMH